MQWRHFQTGSSEGEITAKSIRCLATSGKACGDHKKSSNQVTESIANMFPLEKPKQWAELIPYASIHCSTLWRDACMASIFFGYTLVFKEVSTFKAASLHPLASSLAPDCAFVSILPATSKRLPSVKAMPCATDSASVHSAGASVET